MRTRVGGLLAVILLSSTVLLASSISDPGVKLGPGITATYDTFAVIVSLPDGDFQLLFDGQPFDFTNPFAALGKFCFALETGDIQCDFENQSTSGDGAITSLTQTFVTAFEPGQLTCDIVGFPPPADCNVGGDSHNVVGFTGFSVPTESDWAIEGDSGLNLTYGGFTPDTAAIAETLINGRPLIPEPASLGLMLSGLFGLGLVSKRKARATNR